MCPQIIAAYSSYLVSVTDSIHIMATKPKTTVTPWAKYPDRTEKFLSDVKIALEMLEDEIGSLSEDTRSGAYKNFLESYRDALTPLWNPARFASFKTVLETVANPHMTDLAVMARRLQPTTPSTTIVKEKKMIPDLETIKQALKDKFPDQSLPNKEVCVMIGNVFAKLSTANKAYAEAAELLADLSSLVTPEQYTMLLTATRTPVIQIVVPGQLISPVSARPPSPASATTELGRSDIIKKTKSRVLPNPNSTAITACDENSTTRVLAAATFSKLECHYFDETMSRVDVARQFKCNVSQLSKALTGVDYASGPHHYKPKPKKQAMKRIDTSDPNPRPAKKTSTVPKKSGAGAVLKSPAAQEDTLSSSSSSDELPIGLL